MYLLSTIVASGFMKSNAVHASPWPRTGQNGLIERPPHNMRSSTLNALPLKASVVLVFVSVLATCTIGSPHRIV
jgi:hypothetical protein